MALIKCSECGKEISDKAKSCIHCGCPIEKKSTCSECVQKIKDKATSNVHCKVPIKKNKLVLIISIAILLAIIIGIIIWKRTYYYDTNYTKTVIGYYEQDEKRALIFLKGNENNTQIKYHENKLLNSIYTDDEIYNIVNTCAKQVKDLVPLGYSKDDFVIPSVSNLKESFDASKDLISAFKTHDLNNILSVDTKDDLEFAYAYKSREKIDDLIEKYKNLGFTFFDLNNEKKLTGTYLGKHKYKSYPDQPDSYTELIFNDNGICSTSNGHDEQGGWLYSPYREDKMIYFIEDERIYTLGLVCDSDTDIKDIEKNCLDFFISSYSRHYFYDKETDTIYEPLASNSTLEKIKENFSNGSENPFDKMYKKIK